MPVLERTRTDTQPWTWEIPVAGALAWLVLGAAAAPAGQGVAAFLTGNGWVWPPSGRGLIDSVAGLFTGHPGRGLASGAQVPGAPLVYLLVTLTELALAALSVWVGVAWWRTFGPGARAGVAGHAEVETVLGVSRLRRHRKVIRPDLYCAAGGTRGWWRR